MNLPLITDDKNVWELLYVRSSEALLAGNLHSSLSQQDAIKDQLLCYDTDNVQILGRTEMPSAASALHRILLVHPEESISVPVKQLE